MLQNKYKKVTDQNLPVIFRKLAKFRQNVYVYCNFCSKFKEIITGKSSKNVIEMIFSHIWAENVFI